MEANGDLEICLSSNKALKKQFALAKIHQAEGIVLKRRIKPKRSFKVLFLFASKLEAEKLLQYASIGRLPTVNCSFGIIRHVDVDFKDEEFTSNMV